MLIVNQIENTHFSKTEREIVQSSKKIAEANGFKDIKEGTIYPLLVRLEKKGIITSEMRPSPLGPSRKYSARTSYFLFLIHILTNQ